MHTPKDISDMPESEIPWEFLVDAPERRAKSRYNCTDTSCINLDVTENRLTQLANEFYGFKRDLSGDIREAAEERRVIIDKLDNINTHLDHQKGFFAGVVWLGAGIVGIVGVIIAYIKG